MNRDEPLEQVNVQLMATELERILDKHKGVLDWNDRLEAAGLVSLHYGRQLTAIDAMFSKVIPKYPQIRTDPDLKGLAGRFIEFCDRYNPGDTAGHPFDVRSFQGASLNEVRSLVRSIVRDL